MCTRPGPGTGYKEVHRRRSTDAALGQIGPPALLNDAEPVARSRALADIPVPANYFERFSSFFGSGGLVAAHSPARDRNSIWDALQRKQVYATSGDRILLWFDLANGIGAPHPMGSSVESTAAPVFFGASTGCLQAAVGLSSQCCGGFG